MTLMCALTFEWCVHFALIPLCATMCCKKARKVNFLLPKFACRMITYKETGEGEFKLQTIRR